MNYEFLNVGERTRIGDQIFVNNEWINISSGNEVAHAGRVRRPIADTNIPSFRHMYSANGVVITVDETADIKKAAAFLGAIAMMLDGQADS